MGQRVHAFGRKVTDPTFDTWLIKLPPFKSHSFSVQLYVET
jgi:hypothetical protein